jgi:hypothetical protein
LNLSTQILFLLCHTPLISPRLVFIGLCYQTFFHVYFPRNLLGCKFWRNSGRNSRIPFRLGDFAPRTTEFAMCTFRIFPVFFIMSLSWTGCFARPPPHCEACLGPSERAYLALFGLRDSQRSCFRGS